MRKNTKIALLIVALLAVIAVPISVAAFSTTTTVHYIISTVVAFTLTLPGQSGVTSNSTGAPTPDIEFVSATGTDTDINPCVYPSTAFCQNATTPIFEFDNTGTVDLNISVVLNSDPSACINHTGAASYAGAGTGVQISTANVTVVTDYTPAAAATPWYMKADFSGCTAGDSTTRTLTSSTVES